jgi:squalene synthase HpnC
MHVDQAYARCLRDARDHYENFPVASVLVPAAMRPHIAAVYAFARAADDFADEGVRPAEQRLALLAAWRRRLYAAAASPTDTLPPIAGEPAHADAIFLALGTSIARLQLPVGCFDDLLTAFEQDVTVTRYESWYELLDYCRRSANPVGRLVLRIAGRIDQQLDDWSDCVCTALQLTNFWQDFSQDLARGRIYLPRDTQHRHGVSEDEIQVGPTPGWCDAVEDVVDRTRALFERGKPLPAAVGGRLGLELRATWLGGMRILDHIERRRFDVTTYRPSLGVGDAAWIAVRLFQ